MEVKKEACHQRWAEITDDVVQPVTDVGEDEYYVRHELSPKPCVCWLSCWLERGAEIPPMLMHVGVEGT